MFDVQTLEFKAIVLVWLFSTPLLRPPKELVIFSSDKFEDVDLASVDVLFNIVTSNTALKHNCGSPILQFNTKIRIRISVFCLGV